MNDKQYLCSECVNQATPLCEKCLTITRPSGAESKPTLFVKDTAGALRVFAKTLQGSRLAILCCIETNRPIPIAAVLAYNEALEKARDEQDQT